jgi:DNA repair protein RecN (Recombination protein N)
MQELGMAGGRFEVALLALDEPQAHGQEAIELRVAGHAGAAPRALAKVASGGELSRIALAIAVTTSAPEVGLLAPRTGAVAELFPMDEPQLGGAGGGSQAGTLIFDEVDAGIGGAVAITVGRLMQRLGGGRQVLAVTHLAQVAACADQHFVVSKGSTSSTATDPAGTDGGVSSGLQSVSGPARVAELARMLGGAQHSQAGLAHARELLDSSARSRQPRPGRSAAKRSTSAGNTPVTDDTAEQTGAPASSSAS